MINEISLKVNNFKKMFCPKINRKFLQRYLSSCSDKHTTEPYFENEIPHDEQEEEDVEQETKAPVCCEETRK